jgi:hypothetical protein
MRFRGTAYYLDSKKVWDLPVTQSGQQTTIGKVYESLKDTASLEVETPIVELTVKTAQSEIDYGGLPFNLDLLYVLLKLRKSTPFGAAFFYYDRDWDRGSLQEIHDFFVVSENRIVEEELLFRDYPGSGFDPSIFEAADDDPWKVAWVRWWYRKFYTETQMGQLMALRPDKPELYYCPSRVGTTSLEVLKADLQRIGWLSVVVVVIIAFIVGAFLVTALISFLRF